MEWSAADIRHKSFRTRWKGLDPKEVEIFLNEISDEIERLRTENSERRRELSDLQKEVKEHKEREKAIRNVLLNAHKTVEHMKENAEKEVKLIIAEAEVKAEKILQGAQQRLAQLHEDIDELRRQRVQLETKLRSTVEMFSRLLEQERNEETHMEPTDAAKALDR